MVLIKRGRRNGNKKGDHAFATPQGSTGSVLCLMSLLYVFENVDYIHAVQNAETLKIENIGIFEWPHFEKSCIPFVIHGLPQTHLCSHLVTTRK